MGNFINGCLSTLSALIESISHSWLLVRHIQKQSGCLSFNKAIHIPCGYLSKLWGLGLGFTACCVTLATTCYPRCSILTWAFHRSVTDHLSPWSTLLPALKRSTDDWFSDGWWVDQLRRWSMCTTRWNKGQVWQLWRGESWKNWVGKLKAK